MVSYDCNIQTCKSYTYTHICRQYVRLYSVMAFLLEWSHRNEWGGNRCFLFHNRNIFMATNIFFFLGLNIKCTRSHFIHPIKPWVFVLLKIMHHGTGTKGETYLFSKFFFVCIEICYRRQHFSFKYIFNSKLIFQNIPNL